MPAPASTPTESMPAPEAPAPSVATASASGTVEALDVAAKTVTIAHGPVDALKWPAMTMTFKSEVDLVDLKKGDHVEFEFISTGMDGTITKLTRH
jgi:Cu(I)/Ag(I) efflux system protein CusF